MSLHRLADHSSESAAARTGQDNGRQLCRRLVDDWGRSLWLWPKVSIAMRSLGLLQCAGQSIMLNKHVSPGSCPSPSTLAVT